MPGYSPARGGIQGSTLRARTVDGDSIVLTEDADESVLPTIPPSVARTLTMRATVRQEGTFRTIYRRHISDVTSAIERALVDGRLPPLARRQLGRLADRAVEQATVDARAEILKGMREAGRRELANMARRMQAAGLRPPSPAVVRMIADEVAREMWDRRWPGTQQNTSGRLAILGQRMRALIDPLLRAEDNTQRRQALGNLRRGMHFEQPGPSGVPGGVNSRQLARINRTEQARAVQTGMLRLMRETGIRLAYWRLSPLHKWYGGQEICEKLAVATGPNVTRKLLEMGLDPASENLEGLYLLDAFPMVPHPHCMCLQIPFVPGIDLSGIDTPEATT